MKTGSSYIASFIDYLKFEKRYSAHTVTAYETDLADFWHYLHQTYAEQSIAKVAYQMIRSWIAHLKEKGQNAKTINRKISTLKSFFKFHIRLGNIDANPMLKIVAPKSGKRLPTFIKDADLGLLTRSLESGTEDWKSLNAYMLISLFYATGMRLSELINLKQHHIDHSRRQIKVLGKGNKERIIPVSPAILTAMDDYSRLKRKQFAGLPDVFLVTEKGRKLYPKYAYLIVNKQLASIPTLDKRSPHILRHSFATHLVNNGAELNAVKELLGHASLAATQVYTHNSIEKLKDIHSAAHPKA